VLYFPTNQPSQSQPNQTKPTKPNQTPKLIDWPNQTIKPINQPMDQPNPQVERDQSSPQFVAAVSELRDTLLSGVRPLLQFTAMVVASGEDYGGGGQGGVSGGLQQQQQQALVVGAAASFSSSSSVVSVEAAEEATHALALLFVALCSGENLERLCSIQQGTATGSPSQQDADLELIATVLHMLTNHPCRRIALLTQVRGGGLSICDVGGGLSF
jgi:hypothetical protein